MVVIAMNKTSWALFGEGMFLFFLVAALFSSLTNAVALNPDKAFITNNSVLDLQNYSVFNNESSFQLYWNSTSTLAYDYLLDPQNQQVKSFWSMWHLEWWKVPPSTWLETIPTAVTFQIQNNSPNSVIVYRNMSMGDGSLLNVTYVLNSGSPLKYRVWFKAGNNKQYRLIWRLDSPPSGSKKINNGTFYAAWSNPQFFGSWDFLNKTCSSGNGTYACGYYGLSEDVSPPNRYKLFINVSLNGNPLNVGQIISFDPAIGGVPYQINTSNTAHWLTANVSYSSAGLAVVTWNQTAYNNTLSSTYGGTESYFNLDDNGGGSPIGGFNISGDNVTLTNLFVNNRVSNTGYQTLFYLNNTDRGVNLSFINVTVWKSKTDDTTGSSACNAGAVFFDLCGNTTNLIFNNTIFNHSYVSSGLETTFYLISTSAFTQPQFSYQPNVQIWNSTFMFNGSVDGTGSSYLLYSFGSPIAGTQSTNISIYNSTLYQDACESGCASAGLGRNATFYILNYSKVLLENVNISNTKSGVRIKLFNSGAFAINVTGNSTYNVGVAQDIQFESSGADTNYTQAWWADIQVVSPSGAGISGASVVAYDNQSKPVFSCTTGSTGYCTRTNLTEWNMTAAQVRTVVSFHNFTASQGTQWNQTQANMTGNRISVGSTQIQIVLFDGAPIFNLQYTNKTNSSQYNPAQTILFMANFSDDFILMNSSVCINAFGCSNMSYYNGSATSRYFNLNRTLAAGTYNYFYSAFDNASQSTNSSNFTLVIAKNTTVDTRLFLNGSVTNLSLTYGQTINASGFNREPLIQGNVTLYRNSSGVAAGTLSAIELNVTLAVQTVNYTLEFPESENYSKRQVSLFGFISKAVPVVTLQLNGSSAQTAYTFNPNPFLNASAWSSSGLTIRLLENGTILANATQAESSNKSWVVGDYNWTGYDQGNENYTSAYAQYFANVSKASVNVSLFLNQTFNNRTYSANALETVNASAFRNTTGEGNLTLYRNTTAVAFGVNNAEEANQTSAITQTFNYTACFPESQNYSASCRTFFANFVLNTSAIIDTVSVQAQDFEMNNSVYNLTVSWNSSIVSSIAFIAFRFNNTNYLTADFTNASGNTTIFGKTLQLPLISVNATNFTGQWNYSVTYLNGTVINRTVSFSQSDLWSVYPTAYNFSSSKLPMLSPNQVFLYYTKVISGGGLIVYGKTFWNNTNYNLADQTTFFNSTVVGSPVASDVNVTGYGSLNVSFGSSSFTRNTSSNGYTVQVLLLSTNCTPPNALVLNYTLWNEINTSTGIVGDWQFTFTLYDSGKLFNQNYSFNVSTTQNVSICINLNATNIFADSFQTHQATGFNLRYYFLDHAQLDNSTTQNISVYLLQSSLTKDTLITLLDGSLNPVEGAIVTAQRYYPATNQYLGVAMVKTGSTGQGNTYLACPDPYYRYVAQKNGVVLGSFTSKQINCDPAVTQASILLQIGQGSVGEYFNYVGNLAGNCAFNSTTNYLVCTVQDTSNTFSTFELKVTRLGVTQDTLACSTTFTGSSGTLLCYTNQSGEYVYTLTGKGSAAPVFGGNYRVGSLQSLFGPTGLFLTFLLFITMVGVTVQYSVSASVFVGMLALVVASLIGLFTTGVSTMVAGIIAGIVVGWKLRA